MSRDLGEPPAATRAATPGWRDPRMWVGIVIVAASVVAGSRLMAAADDSVQVWSAASDMGAGDRLRADDLVATRVRFVDDADLAGYFTVDEELPADLELTRGVGAGELLPRAAVGTAGESDSVELPVAVDAEQVPGSVDAGSVVDVWLVPAASRARHANDGPALSGVTVVDAPPVDEGFSTTGKRQLVLAVAQEDAAAFFALLGSLEDPVVTVVRRS
ncbi:hypothetical protein FB382_002747 [Nocardioides ginsengisegetis]|uniref:SAF domain-containing protein n=1 Tax=Nocardioides ginsengisegetis TaxID=661491 RepID=A0A7W3J193_9ACTN|nr:hypothetical protein [Nocardioides ginsengisegetis]MBA8804456.1 hypothetical protein [Nocardioides ginsengisegetis]